jgi:hypothetical protein
VPREIELSGWIEELVSNYGLTEEEAYVFAFLVEAQRIYDNELPEASFNDHAFQAGVQAAQNVLAMRVVRREHPEGWLTRVEREERGKD